MAPLRESRLRRGCMARPRGHHRVEVLEADSAVAVAIDLRESQRDCLLRQMRRDLANRRLQVGQADISLA